MKMVLIGGGSYVFAPTVLEDALVKHRLSNSELILVDINTEAVEAMAAAGSRVARELGVKLRISAATDRKLALRGADYVIVSASPQGAARWGIDYEILKEHGIADQARECGGLGGMLNAFRSITLLMDICRDIETECPDAVLLDVTNPMPRVVTAINKYSSIRAVGFCNMAHKSSNGYKFLPSLVGKAPDEVKIVTAGLNHFAWLLEMKDKQTGENLLPEVYRVLNLAEWNHLPDRQQREFKILRRWLEQYGAVAAGNVNHHAEYLPYQQEVHYRESPPFHGDDAERQRWRDMIRQIGEGRIDWKALFERRCWEHPVDMAVLLNNKLAGHVDILNLPNQGYIAALPEGRIVEVPVTVKNGTWQGEIVPEFPEKLRSLLKTVSDVHEMVAEAAVTGNMALALETIEYDPAIVNKTAANKAFRQMVTAHADMIPQFT
ncbi:MAG: hypothetical protein K0R75_867 [Paenibacillaceae bacterium]|jgi:alpha-galactosidase|nr:hypothetical protein [Paenibacillaceae bacterium]